MRPFTFLFLMIVVLTLAACGGDGDTVPTAVQPASTVAPQPTNVLPPTNDISTAISPDSSGNTPAGPSPEIQSGTIVSGDDFLPIDSILNEIDNEVCQNAYESKQELEALIEEGADLAELETAVEELIAELENCPTPTPQ